MYFLGLGGACGRGGIEEVRSRRSRELLAIAGRARARLERGDALPRAYARMVRGMLAALGGDSLGATNLLAQAIEHFEAVEMRFCSASVRRRLGELIGGDKGQAEVGLADQWMSDQKIRNPARMASMILTELN